jgi:hypothetical protein
LSEKTLYEGNFSEENLDKLVNFLKIKRSLTVAKVIKFLRTKIRNLNLMTQETISLIKDHLKESWEFKDGDYKIAKGCKCCILLNRIRKKLEMEKEL